MMMFEQETHIFFLQQTLQILYQALAMGQGDEKPFERQVEGLRLWAQRSAQAAWPGAGSGRPETLLLGRVTLCVVFSCPPGPPCTGRLQGSLRGLWDVQGGL